MISITKAILFALCVVVVSAKRESINSNSGGAGGRGGSSGRGNTSSSTGSSVTTTITLTNPTNTGTSTTSTSVNNQNTSAGDNSAPPPTTSNNVVTPPAPVTDNFGSTGTLGNRVANVACPICNALPDNSYFENISVNVGTGQPWTCGYLQETVQDTDMNSMYDSERVMCRNAQRLYEEGGCCSQTMYINLPGRDPNDLCTLCGSEVPVEKAGELVNTVIMGSHTCGSLDMIMGQGMLSATMCPQIKAYTKDFCCTGTPPAPVTAELSSNATLSINAAVSSNAALSSNAAAVSRSAPLLRGGVGGVGVVP